MNLLKEIQHFVTGESITLYWNKPEPFLQADRYQVFVDGALNGVADRTHYTVRNLKEKTDYQIQVKICRGERDVWASSECLPLRTGKEKELLDVSKAPYFARGDGKTLNTAALQRAVDDCKADQAVYLPAGVYRTGALRLHSNMELYLEQDAVLQGTDRVEDYLPKIKSRFEGLEMKCYSGLLNLGELDHTGGYNCRNVVIRGKGTIASGGRKLAENVIASEKERLKGELAALGEKIQEYETSETIPGRARPRLVNISNCQDIIISGVTLKNGASWNVHMIYSDRIITNDCTFYSQNVWNGDGWDPDSSTNCTIFGCTFYTGDDSIAIKSGKNPEGNVINRPCAHIRVFDCRSVFGHGITLGSEMSGGIQDVSIWDCDMGNALYGIEIKGTKKRGGYVRDVHVRDCVTSRILFHSVTYNDDGIGAPVPPIFENCDFNHVHILGEYLDEADIWKPCNAIELCGFDEPGHHIKKIRFQDITVGGEKTDTSHMISMRYCDDVTFENVHCR